MSQDRLKNYNDVVDLLSSRFETVNGYDFYRDIFPDNECKGELYADYSHPNAIFLYKDHRDEGSKRTLRRRIMLKDTWENDYIDFIEQNDTALCSGLSYRNRSNRLENAQRMHALIFDLDGVGRHELLNLLTRCGEKTGYRRMPQPTFLVASGGGLHVYYVFEEPIDLFPNIKLQLKALKHDLTFKLWEYKGTSQVKSIQYQSINQGFRMVGSMNNKYGNEVVAFRTGERITLAVLNRYVINEESAVDVTRPFQPSKVSRAEAKELWPEWYARVVERKFDGKNRMKKWDIAGKVNGDDPYALYHWWIRQMPQITGGHRYFFLMSMAIYACKCGVPKKKLRQDMYDLFDELAEVEHVTEDGRVDPLDKKDIESAIEAYSKEYYNFTIQDIEKITAVRIERNKRNYQKQKDHLEEARAIRDIRMKRQGRRWTEGNGRPKGSGTKQLQIAEWRQLHSDGKPGDCIQDTGISKNTVYKWWNGGSMNE